MSIKMKLILFIYNFTSKKKMIGTYHKNVNNLPFKVSLNLLGTTNFQFVQRNSSMVPFAITCRLNFLSFHGEDFNEFTSPFLHVFLVVIKFYILVNVVLVRTFIKGIFMEKFRE